MKETIVIIDDEPDTVELATAILEMNGFRIISFTRPKKALEALKKGINPDLIVLDVRMPELSGPDFCKEIRNDSKLKNLKIVYFTASSDKDEHSLEENKVLGYIFKPFDNDKLVEDVRKYLAMQ